VQNDTADLTVFFAHSRSARVKAACRTLVKFTPGDRQFLQHFTSSFYSRKDPKSKKKDTDDLTVFLHFWDLGSFVNMLVKLTPVVRDTKKMF